MDDYRKDKKIKKAEAILSISRILFIFEVICFVGLGVFFIVISFKDTNPKTFTWEYFVTGISMFVGILFAWASKQLIDGFALNVYSSAIKLHDRVIVTSIDF